MSPGIPTELVALHALLTQLGSDSYAVAAHVRMYGVDAGTCRKLDMLEGVMLEAAAAMDATRLQFRGEAAARAAMERERRAGVARVAKFKRATRPDEAA